MSAMTPGDDFYGVFETLPPDDATHTADYDARGGHSGPRRSRPMLNMLPP